MNKRHYEHTLPNIRGSLSNTYQETFPMIIGEEEIPNERALLTQEDGPMMASSASVKYIVIHCSATRSTRDYTAEQLLRDHKTRGFRTVGYHFISVVTEV